MGSEKPTLKRPFAVESSGKDGVYYIHMRMQDQRLKKVPDADTYNATVNEEARR